MKFVLIEVNIEIINKLNILFEVIKYNYRNNSGLKILYIII